MAGAGLTAATDQRREPRRPLRVETRQCWWPVLNVCLPAGRQADHFSTHEWGASSWDDRMESPLSSPWPRAAFPCVHGTRRRRRGKCRTRCRTRLGQFVSSSLCCGGCLGILCTASVPLKVRCVGYWPALACTRLLDGPLARCGFGCAGLPWVWGTHRRTVTAPHGEGTSARGAQKPYHFGATQAPPDAALVFGMCA